MLPDRNSLLNAWSSSEHQNEAINGNADDAEDHAGVKFKDADKLQKVMQKLRSEMQA